MVWRPTNAGPRNLRELYHWVHGQFVSVGEQVNGGGGVGDHPSLTDRDVADQHPTAAITNLDTEQATQDGRLDALEAASGFSFQSVAMDPNGNVLYSSEAGWVGAYEADGRVRVTFPTAASSNVMQSIVGTANNAGVSPNGTYLFVTEITATDCLVNTQNAAGDFAPRAFSIHRTYG